MRTITKFLVSSAFAASYFSAALAGPGDDWCNSMKDEVTKNACLVAQQDALAMDKEKIKGCAAEPGRSFKWVRIPSRQGWSATE